MKPTISDQALHKLAHESLETSMQEQDSDTRQKLRQLRALAIQQQTPERSFTHWYSVSACAALLIFCLLFWPEVYQTHNPDEVLLVEDLLYLEEQQDLMQDIEFYQWLSETQTHSGTLS